MIDFAIRFLFLLAIITAAELFNSLIMWVQQ